MLAASKSGWHLFPAGAMFIISRFEVRRGVRFDDVAVFLRAPEAYAGTLESAFSRAKIPAHFVARTIR
jgi:ATP-dependent helicase/DNAse subunit B